MEGIVTATPASQDADTYVNNQRIYETTVLQHGALLRFGKRHMFRFYDPGVLEVGNCVLIAALLEQYGLLMNRCKLGHSVLCV